MKKLLSVISVLLICALTTLSFENFDAKIVQEDYHIDDTLTFHVPEGWPKPSYDFQKNPLTTNGIALGRALFYDNMLSRDSSVSCASCHSSYTNFTHIDHQLSHGIDDRIGVRNTLSIMNPAWQTSFMWDGGVAHLDLQPLAPLTSPHEMDMDLKVLMKRLNASNKYSLLFNKAFGAGTEITGYYLFRAMSQFMLTFNTFNAKYDQVMQKKEGVTFTEREQKGLALFRTHCASCHQEPLFTNNTFQNNGLPLDAHLNDGGRIKITKEKNDSLKFRVPSLRNIEVSYPYMHDGRFKSLQATLSHYSLGTIDSETIAPQLKGGIPLEEDDKRNLILFLKTLTDISFLRNKALAYPRY
jgi:cytochrome c peroxidase